MLFDSPFLVSAGRLERPTNGLKGHCSTIELRAHPKAKEFYHALLYASTNSFKLIIYENSGYSLFTHAVVGIVDHGLAEERSQTGVDLFVKGAELGMFHI